jgi:hypothetical protein
MNLDLTHTMQEEDFQREISIDSLMEHVVMNVRGSEK